MAPSTGTTTGGVTIGQAAAFAGVTVKTVRHYHQHGLLDEPRRDSSGYRRYGSADLLRLVQVRTLAAAGVPLAEVGPLLDADAEQFATALTDVERRLTDRIADLIARSDPLRQLADGDRLLLPDRALAILDRLTDLGFSPDYVTGQREALVLARALAPEFFDIFLTQLEHRLDDPEFIDLTKRRWDAQSWDPDAPPDRRAGDRAGRQAAGQPRTAGDTDGLRAPIRRRQPIRADQPPPRRSDDLGKAERARRGQTALRGRTHPIPMTAVRL